MDYKKSMEFAADGTYIKAGGAIDGPAADSLAEAMAMDINYTLDFTDVTSINFAGQRSLLRSHQKGLMFCIVNVSDEVAARMEDTGVASIISICRKPEKLDLSSFDEFGAGFLSKAFNSADGDSILKVYGDRVPFDVVAKEKSTARAVMLFGIPTPLVGTMYSDGANNGIDFERIPGKRSFSRIISEEPERLEEMTTRFAKMCRKLHSTECDTSIFPDRSHFYALSVKECNELDENEKSTILSFIDSIPHTTTCLHGDMQMSNVITDEVDDLWIDLADFGYGNPMFDMGMWYFLSRLIPEKRMDHIFHLNAEQMHRIWDRFSRVYFNNPSKPESEEIEDKVRKFAALHMIHLGVVYGFEEGMVDFIKEQFRQ